MFLEVLFSGHFWQLGEFGSVLYVSLGHGEQLVAKPWKPA